jgi:hypothetical protein
MTRTALKRNGLSELHMRSARKGAKAPSKQRSKDRLQFYYKTLKQLKILLTHNIIESEKERKVRTMKEYKFLVRIYFKNGTKEQRTWRTWIETTKDAKEKAKNCKENMNVEKVVLYRIDRTFEF